MSDTSEGMSDTSEGMSNTDRLHKVILDLAGTFASICDSHGYKYFMMGGTMLGAVRHGGFIPWDDDMDFGMPREDYEAFLATVQEELPENLKLMNYRNTPDYRHFMTRFVDTDTELEEVNSEERNRTAYASVDIFPIDGAPNGPLRRKLYYLRILWHRCLMVVCYKDKADKKRPFIERAAYWFMHTFRLYKLTTPEKQKAKIDKIMSKHKIAGSKRIGNLMGAYRSREIVPAEFYGEGAMYPFEDKEFRGMAMADEYLKWTYGDYMQLSPDESRRTHYRLIQIHGEKIEDRLQGPVAEQEPGAEQGPAAEEPVAEEEKAEEGSAQNGDAS